MEEAGDHSREKRSAFEGEGGKTLMHVDVWTRGRLDVGQDIWMHRVTETCKHLQRKLENDQFSQEESTKLESLWLNVD